MEENKTHIHSTLESGQDFIIEDQWKRRYHFRIASFLVPTGLAFEAIEIKNDDSPVGYRFNQLFDLETDPKIAEQIYLKNKKRIKPKAFKKIRI